MKVNKFIACLISLLVLNVVFNVYNSIKVTDNIEAYALNEELSYSYKVIVLVNQERTARGLQPLKTASTMINMANIRVIELESLFSHQRPDGNSCFTIFEENKLLDGAYSVGENIAMGQGTPEEVIYCWMNSEGHRNNILSPNYEYIGVGYNESCKAWVQVFYSGKKFSDEYIPSEKDSTRIPGDVNGDMRVDSVDASLVLIESAMIGSSGNGEFDEMQRLNGDIDEDDLINSVDAASILQYSAAIGSATTNVGIGIFNSDIIDSDDFIISPVPATKSSQG